MDNCADEDLKASVAGTPPQHITCLLADSGLLWIGTSSGFVLTISLPRLEGLPQLRGRPTVSVHAQFGPVRFLAAMHCNMVPVGRRSAGSTLTRQDAATALQSGAVAPAVDDELVGPLQKQRASSWVSSPDLSIGANDPEAVEYSGRVSDLYGSLLQGMDADFESELAADSSVVVRRRRQNARIQPSTINAVSSRVMNRLSNAISKGRADVRARLNPRPMPKEFRQTSSADADQGDASSPTSASMYEEPRPKQFRQTSTTDAEASVSSPAFFKFVNSQLTGGVLACLYVWSELQTCPADATATRCLLLQ